jgi:uncharacterized repeat protein (TIGR02543 family)
MRLSRVQNVSKLVAGGLLLSAFNFFATPANAAGGINLYISPPFVQGPTASYNANIETYSETTVPSTNGFGWTFDGAPVSMPADEWGSATTTSDTPTVGNAGGRSRYIVPAPNDTFTVTFPESVRYVGFYWPAGNPGNTVHFYTNSTDTTPVATFTSVDVADTIEDLPVPFPGTETLTAINGNSYVRGYYFYHPSYYDTTTPTEAPDGVNNNERHAFVNILASGSYSFKKLAFTGRGFESDNLSVTTAGQTPDPRFVFIKSIAGKSVMFERNLGSGTMDPQVSDSSANISTNQFTRTGYYFSGWNTNANGSGISYANNVSYNFSNDLTLYAQWVPITYSITYYDSNTASGAGGDGGSAPASQSGSAVTSLTLNGNTLALNNYTFAGWATSNGSTTVTYTDSATVSIDTSTVFSLYPVWTPITHSITFSSSISGQSPYVETITVNRTANQSFAFSPISGYRVKSVVVNGVSQGAVNSYTFSNVTTNHSLSVEFELIPSSTSPTPTSPTPTYVPQKSAEQVAAELAAQKLADEKAAEVLATQQKALSDIAAADKTFKSLQDQINSALSNGSTSKGSSTKAPAKTSSSSKSSNSSSVDTSKSGLSVPEGTILITPTQIVSLEIAKSSSGNSANIAISQLKSGQRVKVTVISKADLNSNSIDLGSTQITEVTPNPSSSASTKSSTSIAIKPAPKTSAKTSNQAQVSVTGAKKNQRVRVTIKSK